jgi:SAM-dependent methyltransferase
MTLTDEKPSRPLDPPEMPSYDPAFFAHLYAIEDTHFWFRARNAVISTLIGQLVAPMPDGYRVLEVGCGSGNVLRHLERVCTHGRVYGMDLFSDGLVFARTRVDCPLIQADMHAAPFGVGFNLIGLFDVIEHLPDDLRVLQDLYHLLAPGGALVLTVPAHMALWSYFDDASHHQRRYSVDGLRARLEEAGYEVEYLTPYMAPLFPLLWLGRRLFTFNNRRGVGRVARSDELARRELKIMPGLNRVLGWVLKLEARRIARRQTLAVGTSLLVVARKV